MPLWPDSGACRGASSNGAKIETTDAETGSTALHLAAGWGRVDVVKLLLEHGADKTAKNKHGRTALELAKEAGFEEVVKALEAPPGLVEPANR